MTGVPIGGGVGSMTPPGSAGSPQWSCPKSPEECCSGKSYTSYWFCMALCVLCCCTVELGVIPPPAGVPGHPFPPLKPGIREYPDFSTEQGFSFTKSQYGEFIPIVYGADKLDGNVFWSSGFEEKFFERGGEQYVYLTTSFAIGFCEGELDAILRIWAADKLIVDNRANVDENGVMQPNADGFILGAIVDLTSPDSPLSSLPQSERTTRITVFNGSEDQLPEAPMTDVEGYDNTPGYRGLAYILFENFITEDKTIPPIFAEVLSNTTGLFPRLYFDLPTPQEAFDEVSNNLITYDPSFDQFIVLAEDDSGSGTPANGAGYTVLDGNTLEQLRQIEVVETNSITKATWQSGEHAYTSNGHIVSCMTSSNSGITRIFNGVTGVMESELGPGGGLSGHNIDSGFAAPSTIALQLGYGQSGMPRDILCVAGSTNKSVGVAEISETNEIIMRAVFNLCMPETNNFVVAAKVFPELVEDSPTFADGGNTLGTHFFVFSWNSNERERISVRRFTVSSDTVNILAPEMGDEVEIDLDLINGQGYIHKILQVDHDYVDGCFILQIYSGTAGKPSRLIKWNPFDNSIVWSTPAPLSASGARHQSGLRQINLQQRYGFMGSNGKIYTVDLSTGQLTIAVESLAEQSLPSMTGENYFYNAYENSLTYLSTTADKRVTKVFLNRIERSNVAVANIVTSLLRRVGLPLDQVDVDDLSVFSLEGYTIREPKDLKTIFAELAQVFRFDVVESNGTLLYRSRGISSAETIDQKYLAAQGEDGWLRHTREPDFANARKITLQYRDIEREYMTNVQSVQLPRYSGSVDFDEDAAVDVNVPLVLTADRAKLLAEILLYSKQVYSSQYEGMLPGRYIKLDPSDVIAFDVGEADDITVRLRSVTIGTDKSVAFTASEEDPSIYTDTVNLFGNVGRFTGGDITLLQSRIDPLIMIIPFRTEDEAQVTDSSYLLFLTLLNTRDMAALTKPITVVINGGEETLILDPPTTFPTWGYVITPPLPRTARYSTDMDGFLDIILVHEGPTGTPANAASLAAMVGDSKINLAFVGNELIQFQNVEDLGGGRYRLSILNRCLMGTDAAVASHVSGERFVLLGDATGVLDETSVVRTFVTPGSNGPRKVAQVFLGTNNPWQPAPITFYIGLNLRPFPIAGFQASYGATDLTLSWERNVRHGWVWDDLTEEVELTEPDETYDAYLFLDIDTFSPRDETTYLRKYEVTGREVVYTGAEQTADGFDRDNDTLYCVIYLTSSVTGQDEGLATAYTIYPKE